MWNARDFLQAGSSAQRAAVQGIMDGHAYEKHGDDLPGSSPRDFASSAMRDINTADHTYTLTQAGGENVLFGNSSTGMVGFLNTAQPDKSTYFRPDGQTPVEEYINEKIATIGDSKAKEVTAKDREDINKGLAVDHARSYHDGPQLSERDKSAELEVGVDVSTAKSQQEKSIDHDNSSPTR